MNTKQLPLVTFEQAKRLKALGFNWRVLERYATETNFHNQTLKGKIYNSCGDCGEDYFAPTVALALKWIRGRRGRKRLFAQIIPYYHTSISGNNEYTEFYPRICGYDGCCRGRNHSLMCREELRKIKKYRTYEAAENAALDESLIILEKEEQQ